MTPIEEPITNIIREAMVNNVTRENTYNEIRSELGVSRGKAKQLFYAFLYFPSEQYLTDLIIRED